MEKVYKERKKAFIGAAIGAAASIAGGLIGASKRRKAARRQAAIDKNNREYQTRAQEANAINQVISNYDNEDYAQEVENRIMKYGGKKYKNRKPFGGLGDVIGGVISGAGNILEQTTNVEGLGNAANLIGNSVNSNITNKMAKKASNRIKDNLNAPLQKPNGIPIDDYDVDLPKRLKPMKYGGKYMSYVKGSKGIKVKTTRI